MRNLAKKLSAMALCTVFASMQIASAALNDAVINHTQGGYVGIDNSVKNNATLKFDGNALVNWDRLNVGSGESLNFNAVNGASGLTVVNTVNNGMTTVHGTISANEGIAKLIISNPNGMLYDGANFTTVNDLHLTTQQLNAMYNNATGNVDINPSTVEAIKGIEIKNNSNFNVGGTFTIASPSINIVNSVIKATGAQGLRLVTQNGQDYLLCPTTSNNVNHQAVRLETVQVDGNVYVLAGEDIVKIVNGGTINGDLTVDTKGAVGLNYVSNGNKLDVKGNMTVNNDGEFSYLRNTTVGKDLNMQNDGGYLEIANVNVGGNANLKTTAEPTDKYKHYTHVVGTNNIAGDLNVDSIHNIHIGGYEDTLTHLITGKLNVGGDINATAHQGSIAVTIDTVADKVSLNSGTLNIISNGKAVIKANEYQLKANGYIGGLDSEDKIIDTMEYYQLIPPATKTYLNIDGGKVTKLETASDGYAVIKSLNDMDVNGVNAGKVHLTSLKDIKIGKDAHANFIQVDGDTRNLTVETPSRDYTLKYINIKDTEQIVVNPDTEITYEMANGEQGWNKGTQTAQNTYLVVPGKPVTPPDEPVVPPVDPVVPDNDPTPPQDNDNVKILNNLQKDQVASAIDAQQVYTPVAFAADLDEEIDTGVRKNVDGSVTVVRPYTPVN